MSLIFKIILSIGASFIVWLSYLAIKDVNLSQDMSDQSKNNWVFVILYLPLIGSLFYFIKKRLTN